MGSYRGYLKHVCLAKTPHPGMQLNKIQQRVMRLQHPVSKQLACETSFEELCCCSTRILVSASAEPQLGVDLSTPLLLVVLAEFAARMGATTKPLKPDSPSKRSACVARRATVIIGTFISTVFCSSLGNSRFRFCLPSSHLIAACQLARKFLRWSSIFGGTCGEGMQSSIGRRLVQCLSGRELIQRPRETSFSMPQNRWG